MGEFIYVAFKKTEAYAIHKALELLSKEAHPETFLTKSELTAMSEDIRRASNDNIDNTILAGRLTWKKEFLP